MLDFADLVPLESGWVQDRFLEYRLCGAVCDHVESEAVGSVFRYAVFVEA